MSKLKSLGSKKLVLQSRIDEAKAGLKKLLCDMQQLQSDIRTAQQDVDKIGGEYQEKVLQEPAAGAEPMDVEEIMGKLGLELNDDQKKRWSELKEEMEENKRRKKELLDQVERPPGLCSRHGLVGKFHHQWCRPQLRARVQAQPRSRPKERIGKTAPGLLARKVRAQAQRRRAIAVGIVWNFPGRVLLEPVF